MNLLVLLMGNTLFGAVVTALTNSRVFTRYFVAMNMLFAWGIFLMLAQGYSPFAGLQFTFMAPWLGYLANEWLFAIDGLSFVMLGLSLFVFSMVFVYMLPRQSEGQSMLSALLLLILFMLMGLFCAQDAIAFFVFWEGVMLPLFITVGIWGGKQRTYAAMKFFLYTFVGSLMMLLAVLYIGVKAGSFGFSELTASQLSLVEQRWLFWPLLIGMAIKTPMWPLHTWLPDAHTEAPTEGSVLLASLLLKAGTYAMLRLLVPLVPDACALYAVPLAILSLVAIVYVGMLAYQQVDMKRLIAYSSVAHMGFVTLGIASMYLVSDVRLAYLALMGAVVVMIAHALSSGAMFFAFGMIYDRYKTRVIQELKGIYDAMPFLGAMFMVFVFSTIGLPSTAGFVGEWMVIVAMISSQKMHYGIIAATTMVISAAYMLSVYKTVFLGQSDQTGTFILGLNERLVLLIFAIAIFVLGVYPSFLVDVMMPSIERIVEVAKLTKVVR